MIARGFKNAVLGLAVGSMLVGISACRERAGMGSSVAYAQEQGGASKMVDITKVPAQILNLATSVAMTSDSNFVSACVKSTSGGREYYFSFAEAECESHHGV